MYRMINSCLFISSDIPKCNFYRSDNYVWYTLLAQFLQTLNLELDLVLGDSDHLGCVLSFLHSGNLNLYCVMKTVDFNNRKLLVNEHKDMK